MSRSRAVERLAVTVAEAAEMLALSDRTVERMIDDGTLRSVRLRGARRVLTASINKLLEAGDGKGVNS